MNKKIITLLALIIISTSAFCFAPSNPPIPPQPPVIGGGNGGGINDTQETPIATGTLLLLGLSGAFAGYKVAKRNKGKI